MRTVAAIPAIGLLAGSVAGFIFLENARAPALALLAAGTAASVVAWRAACPRAVALAVGVTFASGGAVLAVDAWAEAWRPTLRVAFEELARADRARADTERRILPEDDEAFAIVSGRLRADASPAPSGVSLSLDVDEISGHREPEPRARRVRGGLMVTVAGSLASSSVDEWRAGRRLRMPVQLHRPARYLDPGVRDAERALARGGTTLVGTVKSGALVELTGVGGWWSESTGRARLFARRAIRSAVGNWSSRSSAIVTAIVIGDRAGLDDLVRRRLQDAGTYHVIAISGGNIAILAGLLLGMFRAAGCLGRSAVLAAIALLAAYAGLVGGGASVERATLMAVVYLAGRAFDHRGSPLNTLCLVAALLVALDPLSVVDPAFVLTFGATLGILVSVPLMQPPRRQPASPPMRTALTALAAALRGLFVASVAAEVMLMPVGAVLFSRITFAGLALNFLAIPLMGVAQLAGMAVVPLTFLSSGLASVAGLAAHLGADGLVRSAELVRFVPVLSHRVASPAWVVVFLYYGSLAAAWVLWQRRSVAGSAGGRWAGGARRGALGAAVFAAVWMLVEPAGILAARGDGLLHVTFLDVGQGDSTLVRFPGGTTMLVDAGGLVGPTSFDPGDRVVAPVLRAAGVRRLDYLVLTHGDPDHIGGAPAIAGEFRPREIWEGIPVPRSAPLEALRLAAPRWANIYRGSRLAVDGVDIVTVHPAPADWERQKVRNDDSIVLDLRWRDVSVLLTGDIGRPTEDLLVDQIPAAPVRVVKVPHHGSLTSSGTTFLRAVHPRLAVFSAGRGNRFGHPAPAVLDRYRDIGAAIARTDRDGAVMLETDGYTVDVRTFTGRRLVIPSRTSNPEGT